MQEVAGSSPAPPTTPQAMSEAGTTREIREAMARLEAQRAVLGDEAVDLALAALGRQLQPPPDASSTGALPADARAEGERKLVTVMFADVSGFTQLASDLDPEEVRNLMNRCFDHLVPAVARYEGTVDKFVGDAIVALFGAPVAHEDDPVRALLAARDMQAALMEFNRLQGMDLTLHFGINTGPVVAGHVGALDRQDYSVMGDAVNIAARLEDLSEPGEILVGHDTFRLTRVVFDYEPLPDVRVKGKDDPIRVYRLGGARSRPADARRVAVGSESPIVGRADELARLGGAIARLERGSGGRIAIVAEAGLGKSRLVAEARRSTGAGVRWAEGRGLSYAQGLSFGVARELLCSLLGVRDDEPPAEFAHSLEEAVRAVAEGDADEITPYLARLFDLELEDERMADKVRHLSGGMLRQRIGAAFRDILRRSARRQPTVIVWEDLHWADASSIDLLESLSELPDEEPLLAMLVFRPEAGRVLDLHRRLAERHGEGYEVVDLTPLGEDESRALVDGYLQSGALPPPTRARILAKAEGNPFFLEQLVHSLDESGAGDAEPLDIPDTVQGVIAARIDRLPVADKRALQAASVIGRIFQRQVLRRLIGDAGREDLEISLGELARRAFVRPRERGTAAAPGIAEIVEYIFKHVITHEVSYGTLLLARRRELHRRTGEAVEALFPEQREELAGTLGFHFQRAGEHARAAEHLLKAGDRAKAQYANEEALGFYRAAREEIVRLLKSELADRERWESAMKALEEGVGEVLARVGRNTEARAAYEAALERLADEDRIGRSRLLRRVAMVWNAERRFSDALAAVNEAKRVLGPEPAADPEGWRLEINELGLDRVWVHYWLGEWSSILDLVEAIRPALEAHGTALQQARLHQGVVLALMRRNHYTPSEDLFESAREALRFGERSGSLAEAAQGRFALGFVYFFARDLEAAERYLTGGLALAERIGEISVLSRCLTYLTAVHRMGGSTDAAEGLATRSLDLAREYRMIEYEAAAEGNLGWVAWRRGDPEGALSRCRRAVDLWTAFPGPAPYPFQWFARWPLLAAAVAGGEQAAAVDHADALLAVDQQPPPGPIAQLLEAGIATEPDGEGMARLAEAVTAASQIGYL